MFVISCLSQNKNRLTESCLLSHNLSYTSGGNYEVSASNFGQMYNRNEAKFVLQVNRDCKT